MPIYAYKCESCGHRQDVLQKLSDPLLTVCPACAAPSFVKQVTAAGFQLKGSGWYVTDFRDGGGKKPSAGEGDKPAGTADKPAAADAAAASGGASGATAAPAPSPAPSAAPSAPPSAAPSAAPAAS